MYIGMFYSTRNEFRFVVMCFDSVELVVLVGWATLGQCLVRGFSLADGMEFMFIDL